MRNRLAGLSPRSRIFVGAIIAIVFVYILLVTVFGRPYGIVSFNTSEELKVGSDVVLPSAGWDQLNISDLIGDSLAEAKDKLGRPGIDNTLAPEDQGGLKVVVDKAPSGTQPADNMTVVGYCATTELADRIFLTLAVSDPGRISAAASKEMSEDPQEVAYRYMKSNRCDGESIGQFTPWIDVKPVADR